AGDEGGELAGHTLTRAGVELGRVRGQEQMAGVAVKLGPLAVVQRVLDRQRVQPELLAEHTEIVAVRVAQVEPDGDRLIGQVIADVGDREALERQPPVPVQPGTRLAPGGADLAERGRRHRLRITAAEGLTGPRPGTEHAAAGSRRPDVFFWR